MEILTLTKCNILELDQEVLCHLLSVSFWRSYLIFLKLICKMRVIFHKDVFVA